MKFAVAGDSAGAGFSAVLAEHLKRRHQVRYLFCVNGTPDAFCANLSDRLALAVMTGENDRANLGCGSGVGVGIAANALLGNCSARGHDFCSSGKATTSHTAQIIQMSSKAPSPEPAKDVTVSHTHGRSTRSATTTETVNDNRNGTERGSTRPDGFHLAPDAFVH